MAWTFFFFGKLLSSLKSSTTVRYPATQCHLCQYEPSPLYPCPLSSKAYPILEWRVIPWLQEGSTPSWLSDCLLKNVLLLPLSIESPTRTISLFWMVGELFASQPDLLKSWAKLTSAHMCQIVCCPRQCCSNAAAG